MNAVEIKQEIDEDKPRKSRRSANTSLNSGENQNPLQEVGRNSKPNRNSGKKPGLKQKGADKENEKVAVAEESDNDLEVSFKEDKKVDAVEIKQEIDEAKPRKSRRSANTSLNCGENQNPLQEVGQTSKPDRDSGKKPGLKQKDADKENEKVAAVEIKQEINEAEPRKSRRSGNTSLTSGGNQNPLQEVGQTSKPDRNSEMKPGLKQTKNSLNKKSATKTTKNSGKRKRGKKRTYFI